MGDPITLGLIGALVPIFIFAAWLGRLQAQVAAWKKDMDKISDGLAAHVIHSSEIISDIASLKSDVSHMREDIAEIKENVKVKNR